MFGSGDLLVEDGNSDGLNVFPWFMKRRNIHDRVHADAIPSEENHRSRKFLRALLQLSDEVMIFRDCYQALYLLLVRGRQILEPIDAFIDVRERQQIEQNIDR